MLLSIYSVAVSTVFQRKVKNNGHVSPSSSRMTLKRLGSTCRR
jgi:hypothetical protein